MLHVTCLPKFWIWHMGEMTITYLFFGRFLQFFAIFSAFFTTSFYGFGTWPKWPLRPLHVSIFGVAVTHSCRFDWNGTVPFRVDNIEGSEEFSRQLTVCLSVQHFPDGHVEGSTKVINIKHCRRMFEFGRCHSLYIVLEWFCAIVGLLPQLSECVRLPASLTHNAPFWWSSTRVIQNPQLHFSNTCWLHVGSWSVPFHQFQKHKLPAIAVALMCLTLCIGSHGSCTNDLGGPWIGKTRSQVVLRSPKMDERRNSVSDLFHVFSLQSWVIHQPFCWECYYIYPFHPGLHTEGMERHFSFEPPVWLGKSLRRWQITHQIGCSFICMMWWIWCLICTFNSCTQLSTSTQLLDAIFNYITKACSATDTMYHVLVHSQKSHMRNCLFRFYVTVNYKLFKSSTFLPLYRSLHPYDVFKQLQNTRRTH